MKKRIFGLFLIALIVCALFPNAARAAAGNAAISYNLENEEVPLHESDFRNGEYTIPLEDNPFFPYEVRFTVDGQEQIEWFADENAAVTVGGYTFRVSFNGTARSLAFLVGGERVDAIPEDKFYEEGDLGLYFYRARDWLPELFESEDASYNFMTLEVYVTDRLWSEMQEVTLAPPSGNLTVWRTDWSYWPDFPTEDEDIVVLLDSVIQTM